PLRRKWVLLSMRHHVLPFQVTRHHLATVRPFDPNDVREILALVPILAQVNPSGLGTTIRLMRNLIGNPESSGTEEALHAISAKCALFTQTANHRRHRR